MKVTDPKVLRELYDIEAEYKMLIGYRFKGCLPAPRTKGRPAPAKHRARAKRTARKPNSDCSLMRARPAAAGAASRDRVSGKMSDLFRLRIRPNKLKPVSERIG